MYSICIRCTVNSPSILNTQTQMLGLLHLPIKARGRFYGVRTSIYWGLAAHHILDQHPLIDCTKCHTLAACARALGRHWSTSSTDSGLPSNLFKSVNCQGETNKMGKSHSHTGRPSLKTIKGRSQSQADMQVNLKGNIMGNSLGYSTNLNNTEITGAIWLIICALFLLFLGCYSLQAASTRGRHHLQVFTVPWIGSRLPS